jgi:hypothetical protein
MPSAQVTITGLKQYLPSGQDTLGPLIIFNPSSAPGDAAVALVTGNNTILVPSSTLVSCVIIPPTTNTTAITAKGASGDTGLPLNPGNPTLYSFPPGTASFILNAAAGVNVELWWF